MSALFWDTAALQVPSVGPLPLPCWYVPAAKDAPVLDGPLNAIAVVVLIKNRGKVTEQHFYIRAIGPRRNTAVTYFTGTHAQAIEDCEGTLCSLGWDLAALKQQGRQADSPGEEAA